MTENGSSNDYSREYKEKSFWDKLGNHAVAAGKQVIEKALVLYYCLQDPDTPVKEKAIILAALGYFILPLDAIPDVTPGVGYMDDLGSLLLAFKVVFNHIKPEHHTRAREKLTQWFGDDASEPPIDV